MIISISEKDRDIEREVERDNATVAHSIRFTVHLATLSARLEQQISSICFLYLPDKAKARQINPRQAKVVGICQLNFDIVRQLGKLSLGTIITI